MYCVLLYYVFIDIGYCQGMNDILSRFLVVTDSEVDSYWMFCNYMEYKRADFLEDSMMNKIGNKILYGYYDKLFVVDLKLLCRVYFKKWMKSSTGFLKFLNVMTICFVIGNKLTIN